MSTNFVNLNESHNRSSMKQKKTRNRMPEHRMSEHSSYDNKVEIRFSLYDLTPSTSKRWVKAPLSTNINKKINQINKTNEYNHELIPNIPSKNSDNRHAINLYISGIDDDNKTLNTSTSSRNDEVFDRISLSNKETSSSDKNKLNLKNISDNKCNESNVQIPSSSIYNIDVALIDDAVTPNKQMFVGQESVSRDKERYSSCNKSLSSSLSAHHIQCILFIIMSVIFSVAFLLPALQIEFKINALQSTLIPLSSIICSFVGGAFVLSLLTDKFGKRKIIIVAVIMTAISGVISAYAEDIYIFESVARFFVAFFMKIGVIAYIYTLLMLLILITYLDCRAYVKSSRIPLWIIAIAACWMPQSAHYLIRELVNRKTVNPLLIEMMLITLSEILSIIIGYFMIDWKRHFNAETIGRKLTENNDMNEKIENKHDLSKAELLDDSRANNDNEVNQELNYRLIQWEKVINQYSEYVNNQYDEQQINALFKNIDIPLLLNDFLYLLSKPKCIENFQFDSCDPQKCKIYHRKYRKYRKYIERDKYKSMDHDENVAHIQILDKIHCYYCHHHHVDIKEIQQPQNHRYNQLEFNNEQQSNNNKLYSFGIEFKYGYDGEEAHYNSTAISPKYSSLKQELTTNRLSTISIDQFNNEYEKALIHFNSEYRKRYHSNMGIEHLLALMLYCNFDSLQYELSKTYRENNGSDHNNYYHWGKLLKIAVKIYGTKIEKGDIKAFYHGIGDKLLLPQYSGNGYGWSGVQIFCPLSTTSSCSVAANFTNNYNGLIIEFGGDAFRCNDTKYFSVQWLSDYSHENEYLFIQNQYGLQINNIINMQNSEEYRGVLDALKMFDSITTGYGTDDETLDSVERMQHIINKMISGKIKSEYIGEIFDTFCKNKKLMVLDYNKFKYKYPILFNRLFVSESDDIFTLFNGLDVLNINFCDKYISSISLHDLIQRFYSSRLNRMELWNVNVYYDDDQLYAVLQIYQRQWRRIKMVITKRKGSYHLCFRKIDTAAFKLNQI